MLNVNPEHLTKPKMKLTYVEYGEIRWHIYSRKRPHPRYKFTLAYDIGTRSFLAQYDVCQRRGEKWRQYPRFANQSITDTLVSMLSDEDRAECVALSINDNFSRQVPF